MNSTNEPSLLQQKLEQLELKYQALDVNYRQLKQFHDALFEISKLVESITDLERFYQEVHRIVGMFMDAKNFFIVLYDKEAQDLEFCYGIDEYDELPAGKVPFESFKGSLTRYIIESGESLLATPEVIVGLIDEGKIRHIGAEGVDWLGVPLKRRDEVIGVMVVQSYSEATRYNHMDLELLEFSAQHVAIAQFQIRHRTELQHEVVKRTAELREQITERQNSELVQESLYHISELSSSEEDLSALYPRLHNIIGQLLSAQNFYIVKYYEESEELEFVYFIDQLGSDGDLTGHKRKRSNSFTDYVLLKKQPVLLDDAKMMALYQQGKTYKPSGTTYSWLGVPLMDKQMPIGAIVLQSYSPEITFTEQDAELLNFVSQHVVTAFLRREAAVLQKQTRDLLEHEVRSRTSELEKEIQQRRKVEEQLKHTASHDSLTGLPNRVVFLDMLSHAIKMRQRRKDYEFAVLFLDLDRFKGVNDGLGHHAGDELLKQVAVELQKQVRGMDTVARFGGDEFVILVEDVHANEDVVLVASRLTQILQSAFIIENQEVYIGTSIGVVFSADRYQEPSEMLRDADTAMYQAKSAGRGCYQVFDASMHQQVLDAISLEADIRAAIDKSEFYPYFQPIIELNTNKVVGFEALARWQSEKRGAVYPNEFIPIAEENGLISFIDMLIVSKAAEQVKKWHQITGDESLYVSTNFFANQFFDESLPVEISNLLDTYELPPQCLRMELTERALLENSEVVLANMEALKKLGVRLLLDDFGTGYSSLSYLYRFPLDVLKIDRSFVSKMTDEKSSKEIVKTIIQLARNLNLDTVGEGIEDADEAAILTKENCIYGQGYYFAKPMTAEQATEFLKQNN